MPTRQQSHWVVYIASAAVGAAAQCVVLVGKVAFSACHTLDDGGGVVSCALWAMISSLTETPSVAASSASSSSKRSSRSQMATGSPCDAIPWRHAPAPQGRKHAHLAAANVTVRTWSSRVANVRAPTAKNGTAQCWSKCKSIKFERCMSLLVPSELPRV